MFNIARIVCRIVCVGMLFGVLSLATGAAIAGEDFTYAELRNRSFVGEDLTGSSFAAANANEAS